MVIRGVVLDLDDTLYLERDYVRSGFSSVADLLVEVGRATHCQYLAMLAEIAEQTENTGRVFDELLARVDLEVDVETLVDTYRRHKPTISLIPGARDFLLAAGGSGLRLGMITDGYVVGQENKIAALGLADLVDPIVITDRWGTEYRKPADRAFRFVESRWAMAGSQLLYVGDNPSKDFLCPRQRDWLSIRITHPGQLYGDLEPAAVAAAPTATLDGFGSLASAVLE